MSVGDNGTNTLRTSRDNFTWKVSFFLFETGTKTEIHPRKNLSGKGQSNKVNLCKLLFSIFTSISNKEHEWEIHKVL